MGRQQALVQLDSFGISSSGKVVEIVVAHALGNRDI